MLLLDEPTRGIDVGAKAELYRQHRPAGAGGLAVLVIRPSCRSFGPERPRLVLREGRMAGELERDELSPERVMAHAFGLGAQPEAWA